MSHTQDHTSTNNTAPAAPGNNSAPVVKAAKPGGTQVEIVELDPAQCSIFAGNGRAQVAFDPQKNAPFLADIQLHGQKTPVIVRQTADGHEVIAGTRRYGAVTELKRTNPSLKLRAFVVLADDARAWAIAERENANRRDLSPLERANSWRYATDHIYGGNQAEFAKAEGLPESTVSRTLALLKIPVEITAALRNPEKINVHFATQLIPILKDEERTRIAIAVAENLVAESARLSGAALLATLLKTPAERQEMVSVPLAMGAREKYATLAKKSDGRAVLALSALDGPVPAKVRQAFLNALQEELRRYWDWAATLPAAATDEAEPKES
jgi:ParB family chromosome partitioning protein